MARLLDPDTETLSACSDFVAPSNALKMWHSKSSGREEAYLTNVDESTHQVLIAEGIDRLLGLFPSCIFHNTVPQVSKDAVIPGKTLRTRIPT